MEGGESSIRWIATGPVAKLVLMSRGGIQNGLGTRHTPDTKHKELLEEGTRG